MSDLMLVQIILTVLLFLALLVMFIVRRFHMNILRQVQEILRTHAARPAEIVREEDLARLPPLLQKHLRRAGVVGKPRARTVRLKQRGKIRSGPSKAWMTFEAEEYYTVDPPGLEWLATVWMSGMIPLAGWDSLRDGRGRMIIKLLGVFPVVDAAGAEIDQGSLMRWLNEIMWFPSAYLSPEIRWEQIDETRLRASISVRGVSAEAVLVFNDEGDLVNFEALRQREAGGQFILTPWSTPVGAVKELGGVRIPAAGGGVWKLESEDFNYIQAEITEIETNPGEVYRNIPFTEKP